MTSRTALIAFAASAAFEKLFTSSCTFITGPSAYGNDDATPCRSSPHAQILPFGSYTCARFQTSLIVRISVLHTSQLLLASTRFHLAKSARMVARSASGVEGAA